MFIWTRLGDERVVSFSIEFNPAAISIIEVLASPESTLAPASELDVDLSQAASGRIGVLFDIGRPAPAGSRRILLLRVYPPPYAVPGTYPIAFGNVPSPQSVSNSSAALVPATFQPGSIVIPGSCTFSITPNGQTFTAAGGTGTATVTQTSPGPPCPWTAAAAPTGRPFVTLSNSSGSGNGSFTFSVAPNGTQFGRASTIELIIPDTGVRQPFVVSQPVTSSSCTYLLTPGSVVYSKFGGEKTVRVTTGPACPWTASINPVTNPYADWINVIDQSGTGTADIRYNVQVSPSPAAIFRSAKIEVNGQLHVVNQKSYFCPFVGYDNGLKPLEQDDDEVSQLRAFRDDVLAETSIGEKFIEDYYEYAGEVTRLLIFNPDLLRRSKDALDRYKPVVDSALRRQRAKAEIARNGGLAVVQADLEPTVVKDSELDDVDEVLQLISLQASGQLRQKLGDLRGDIRDPRIQAEFGVRIEHGARRPMPNENSTLTGILNSLWPLDAAPGTQFLNSSPAVATVAEAPRKNDLKQTPPSPLDDAYGKIPLTFEANQGQVNGEVKYLSRGTNYNLFLTSSEAVISLPAPSTAAAPSDRNDPAGRAATVSKSETEPARRQIQTIRMKLDGADEKPRIIAHDQVSAKSNYFVGNDSRKWRTGIPNYSKVEYKRVYDGVDLIYYGNQKELEYDFKVAPGRRTRQRSK